MSTDKFLDKNGLLYVWQKIKTLLAGKVDKVTGKELSDNNYSDSEKAKVAASIVSMTLDQSDDQKINYTTNGGSNGSVTIGKEVQSFAGTTNFPASGVAGKLYLDTSTSQIYRWAGNSYQLITRVGGVVGPQTATNDNIAVYDNSGYKIKDGGKKISDLATKADTELTTTLSRGRKANATVGTGSVAFGENVEASGNYSKAEGYGTTASGYAAQADGVSTVAAGYASKADGNYVTANGNYSRASGMHNVEEDISALPEWVANTEYAVGARVKRTVNNVATPYECKVANSDSSFTLSKWIDRATYAEIVGNGTGALDKSNARALDWSGNEYLKGNVYVGCDADSKNGTKLVDATEHATDMATKADKADTVLDTTLSRGRKANTTVGTGSIAFGDDVEASSKYSVALGYRTVASQDHAFAIGTNTKATGDSSVAEGINSEAVGPNSHAQGRNTVAKGTSSHASGEFNVEADYPDWQANHDYVVGDAAKVPVDNIGNVLCCICKTAHNSGSKANLSKWNLHGKYLEMIGNGTSMVARSNARAVDWDGNEYLKGDIYIGCNADSSGGTKVATIDPATSSANGLMTSTDKAKLDEFGAASTYALKSDITAMYKYKGSVATAAALPASGQTVGDVYNIEASSVYGGAGMNVAWNGTAWDPLGEIFTVTTITNAEIDDIFAA